MFDLPRRQSQVAEEDFGLSGKLHFCVIPSGCSQRCIGHCQDIFAIAHFGESRVCKTLAMDLGGGPCQAFERIRMALRHLEVHLGLNEGLPIVWGSNTL